MTVFLLSHVVISRTSIKPSLVVRFGTRTYLTLYSTLSLLLLAWVIHAVLTAERIVLWSTPAWSYGFAVLVSAIAFVLIGIGALSPNPLSVAFRKTGFDPNRPGAVGWVRHPLILGLTLWAAAHVPGNGDWPSLVLFVGSLLFGLLGLFAVERRLKHRLGNSEWLRLTRGRGNIDRWMMFGAAAGLALWASFLNLHPTLFGADPLSAALGQLSS
mgnify:CR=1 FL=1